MRDFALVSAIVLTAILIGYWFLINTEWQFRLKKKLFVRKVMRSMRKQLIAVLGAMPRMCKDGKHVMVGKRVFTREEYEQYYRECMLKHGYKETEYGWEKEQ